MIESNCGWTYKAAMNSNFDGISCALHNVQQSMKKRFANSCCDNKATVKLWWFCISTTSVMANCDRRSPSNIFSFTSVATPIKISFCYFNRDKHWPRLSPMPLVDNKVCAILKYHFQLSRNCIGHHKCPFQWTHKDLVSGAHMWPDASMINNHWLCLLPTLNGSHDITPMTA